MINWRITLGIVLNEVHLDMSRLYRPNMNTCTDVNVGYSLSYNYMYAGFQGGSGPGGHPTPFPIFLGPPNVMEKGKCQTGAPECATF